MSNSILIFASELEEIISSGDIKMNRCYISEQIAEHCNEEECFCPKCMGNMYYCDTRHDVLVCVECHHEVDLSECEL